MIDYELQELFNQGSVNKKMYITYPNGTITNTELHEEEFTLLEPLTTDDELTFGSCEASSVSFTVSNVFNGLDNAWLDISVVLNHNEDKPFKIGKYKVYSNVPTADRVRREILAYDAMFDIVNMDVAEWYNTILPNNDSSVTLKKFRDGFFEYVGINQVETILPNDDMIVAKTIQADKISGKDIVTAICEINGCFGHINRDGDFAYVFLKSRTEALYPSDDLFPDETLYPADENSVTFNTGDYYGCQYEDYTVQKIDALEIRQQDDSAGVIVGDGNNRYVMSGNMLILGKTDEELSAIAENIFGVIKHIEYRPFEATMRADLCNELGDLVRFNTKYEIVRSYILERRITGIQNLIDTMSASGEEYRTAQVNNLYNDVIQLKGKTNTLERTAEQTLSKIEDLEEQTSTEIQQLADSVAITIDEKGNVLTDLTLDANGISFSGKVVVISAENFELNEDGEVMIRGTAYLDNGLSIYIPEYTKVNGYKFDAGYYNVVTAGKNSVKMGVLNSGDGTSTYMEFDREGFATLYANGQRIFHANEYGLFGTLFFDVPIAADEGIIGEMQGTDGTMRVPVGSTNEAKNAVAWMRAITNTNGITRIGVNGLYGGDDYQTLYATVDTSDDRLKTDISDTEVNALDLIKQIKHRQFTWKKQNSKQNIGYIAQELEQIEKRMVISPERDDEYYQVNTFYMMGLATKAIQELSAENNKLRKEMEELKKSVSFLVEKLGGMANE